MPEQNPEARLMTPRLLIEYASIFMRFCFETFRSLHVTDFLRSFDGRRDKRSSWEKNEHQPCKTN